jgi:hypothetical protein
MFYKPNPIHMRKSIAILTLAIIAFSCSQKKTLESRVQAYIKDTVLQNFNDPSSYQFVSMSIDTMSEKETYEFGLKWREDYLKDKQRRMDSALAVKDDIMANVLRDGIASDQKELDSLKANPVKDRLWYLINVKCRAKNKMGALILNNMKFKYYPDVDKMQEEETE